MSQQDIRLTVDVVIQRGDEVLLINRKADPYQGHWALPGGFVEDDELIIRAAVRELKEETNLDISTKDLKFIGYFDAIDRDPRGRSVSLAFGCQLSEDQQPVAGDDAGEVSWFQLQELPELAFDHLKILQSWREKLIKT